ncbi:MAG TPA: cbb3-type cytochrome oxidase assembly protein CcoS [Stellaceae bacterium]|nr:cbb3-type cytochrome oxidase assembly protein CcoS [Stellaceae bacterium]
MTGLLFLIPIALAMGLAGLLAFLWALKSGQYDDLDGAAGRVLFDDPPAGSADPVNPPPRIRSRPS